MTPQFPGPTTRFLALRTPQDFADLLEIPLKRLSYILYKLPLEQKYRYVKIAKKRGGTRTLSVPHPALKKLQRRLCTVLNQVYTGRAPVHGYVLGRSIKSNALRHVRRRVVLTIDLENFFPSIHFGRVRGLLMAKPYSLPEPVARYIAQLCCIESGLPQGAPTSPIISNMVCSRLDRDLLKLAAHYKCIYTRYADDISFSSYMARFPEGLASLVEQDGVNKVVLGDDLVNAVVSNGFTINSSKGRLRNRRQRQEVTGLTVNEFPNVRRRFVRQIRAALHAVKKYGYDAANGEYNSKYKVRGRPGTMASLANVLRGKIEFVRMVREPSSPLYLRLAQQLREIVPDYRKGESAVAIPAPGQQWDVFVVHASEDKDNIVRPLSKALENEGVLPWVDEGQIRWGDSIIQRVNQGLANSHFVIVVLSLNSYKKAWPLKELQSALAVEIPQSKTRVLPLLVGDASDVTEILETLPLLRDKAYLKWDDGIDEIVRQAKELLS